MSKKEYKVIVAHPGKQHSFRLAEALKDKGILYKYITTVYNTPHSLTNILSSFFLSGYNEKRAENRRCAGLHKSEIKQFCELEGLIILILVRLPKLTKVYRFFNDFVADLFGKKIAKYAIKNNVDAVIMYDSTATKCFEILKKKAPHIIRIMDVSISTRHFMKNVFEEDMKQTSIYEFKKEYSYMWDDKKMYRMQKEIEDSDYFLSPSNIVKESLVYCGAKEEQIKIVPYGVDISKFNYNSDKEERKALNLIYVGQINHRKGIHHLLKVVSSFDKEKVTLKLVGIYDKNSTLYKKYSANENIKFLGFITHDRLNEVYKESDVFIFPTLGEGYGLVVLEAMSCGLPVICSSNAGGNDAVVDSYNGFVFPAGDDKALTEKIQWFLDNRGRLPEMSVFCRKTAEQYSWKQYYDRTQNEVYKILEGTM